MRKTTTKSATVFRTITPAKHRLDGVPGPMECRDAAKIAMTDAIAKYGREHGPFDFTCGTVTIVWSKNEVAAEAKSQ